MCNRLKSKVLSWTTFSIGTTMMWQVWNHRQAEYSYRTRQTIWIVKDWVRALILKTQITKIRLRLRIRMKRRPKTSKSCQRYNRVFWVDLEISLLSITAMPKVEVPSILESDPPLRSSKCQRRIWISRRYLWGSTIWFKRACAKPRQPWFNVYNKELLN